MNVKNLVHYARVFYLKILKSLWEILCSTYKFLHHSSTSDIILSGDILVFQKAEKASEFANDEIIPELQKIYKAAAAAAESEKSTTERSIALPKD